MRQTFIGCKVVMTPGIAALDPIVQSELVEKVQTFNVFTPDNDPHEEHDFGKIVCSDGSECFWKFDYYDDNYTYFQEDGNRVLTIMLTHEY